MKTDTQLQQDVMAELQWEPSVHAAQIGVEVRRGVVTLVGQIDSYSEKWRAEHAAQRVSGLKAMTSELRVHLPTDKVRTDAHIADAVANTLAWTASLPANGIQVMVEAGWVTLSGDVEWQYQRETAADTVRHLLGVTGVCNLIGVRPSVSALAVKSDIEAALMRSTHADARTITVDVHGTDVTLSGTVHDWAERDAATHSAWRTPGVRNVVDMMTLEH